MLEGRQPSSRTEPNNFIEVAAKKECYATIGSEYWAGNYVKEDYNRAFQALIIAAQLGDILSIKLLANCYRNGRGTAIDMRKAFEWNLIAAKSGNTAKPAPPEQALLEDFAGNAQTQAGLDYYLGNGVNINKAEAAFWFERAAEQGDKIAQYNLGLCYLKGEGVSQNDAEAAKWFLKAAEQGNASGMGVLGECYFYGWGVAKNMKSAADWTKKAIHAGDEQARQFLQKHPELKR